MIPEDNLIEISYEELTSDSFALIKRIYTHMKLEGFESAADDLRKTIDHENAYRNNTYKYSSDIFKKIGKYWGKFIKQWNYKEPVK